MTASVNSRPRPGSELLIALVVLAALSASAVAWIAHRGYTLYYGDAEAHLNIARRVLDSRTPGLSQIGPVWLPLPHLLMLPLAGSDALWRSGLAGAIPSAFCFVAAGLMLFAAARRVLGDPAAAWATLGVFALNANALYLQAVPMTEPVLAATLAALLYSAVRFRESQSLGWAAVAGAAGLATSLARYEGWLMIPAVSLFVLFAARRRRLLAAALFGLIASLGPLLWLAYSWYYSGDPLGFYRGPYSALAIYQRLLDSGLERYRGDQDWAQAMVYYWHAVRLAAGWPALLLGLAGAAAAAVKRVWWPLLLLLAPPALIVASIHSGGTPIYLPHLWPFSYWNTRFGVTALPALAFAAGALVLLAPGRFRALSSLLVALLAVAPWLGSSWPENSICWKESQVNSEARRAWVRQGAAFMREHYRSGAGILMHFSDLPAILREAGIPLRESLQQDNQPEWSGAMARPSIFLHEEWAVAIAGDPVEAAMKKAAREGPRYDAVKAIAARDEFPIYMYRRR